jgi:hypothetical protein
MFENTPGQPESTKSSPRRGATKKTKLCFFKKPWVLLASGLPRVPRNEGISHEGVSHEGVSQATMRCPVDEATEKAINRGFRG